MRRFKKPTKTGRIRAGLTAWILTAACLLGGCSSPRPPANVLFIVIDTLRQDHLGCYGHTRETSPAIDRLAADSLRFERAYSTAPWTIPSVASMITGLYPSTHGTTRLTTKLPDELMTMAEVFAAAGYRTAGVVSHTVLTKRWNFQQGYLSYQTSEARGHDHISAPAVTRQARTVLQQLSQNEEPFYLFVHYFDPHYEFKRYPEHPFAPASAGRLDGTQTIAELRAMLDTMTPEEIEFIKALYDEEIRRVDDGIGLLLEDVKKLGLYDDTLVVLTADHGEEFLAHGWLGHTRTLYDELVRVPLLIRLPYGEGKPGVVEEPVSHVALMPTMLDIAGVDRSPYEFQGESFVPLFREHAPVPGLTAFFEVDYIPLTDAYSIKITHKKGLATNRHKVIRDDESRRVELYDLIADSGELDDLADREPALARQMTNLLDRNLAYARGGIGENEDLKLTEEEMETLRGLGYIGP